MEATQTHNHLFGTYASTPYGLSPLCFIITALLVSLNSYAEHSLWLEAVLFVFLASILIKFWHYRDVRFTIVAGAIKPGLPLLEVFFSVLGTFVHPFPPEPQVLDMRDWTDDDNYAPAWLRFEFSWTFLIDGYSKIFLFYAFLTLLTATISIYTRRAHLYEESYCLLFIITTIMALNSLLVRRAAEPPTLQGAALATTIPTKSERRIAFAKDARTALLFALFTFLLGAYFEHQLVIHRRLRAISRRFPAVRPAFLQRYRNIGATLSPRFTSASDFFSLLLEDAANTLRLCRRELRPFLYHHLSALTSYLKNRLVRFLISRTDEGARLVASASVTHQHLADLTTLQAEMERLEAELSSTQHQLYRIYDKLHATAAARANEKALKEHFVKELEDEDKSHEHELRRLKRELRREKRARAREVVELERKHKGLLRDKDRELADTRKELKQVRGLLLIEI